ncbi:MAG TPA: L-serine ammonia-lyase, iron-sulfur-dependent subunit beta [Coriobacteriia bacterium]
MSRIRSVFEIVGPVMIGPSSSHTAGAVRLGRLAAAVFGGTPSRARILLHGSFASTGPGHGTDLALVAGLLGMSPDDERIVTALSLAKVAGLEVAFESADLGEAHPNTARFHLTDAEGREMLVQGCSVGGGDVVLTRIDDFDVEVSGDLPVLVVEHADRPGVIAGVSAVLAEAGVNIAGMRVSRERRGARALMLIETDQAVDPETVDAVCRVHDVLSVRSVPAV